MKEGNGSRGVSCGDELISDLAQGYVDAEGGENDGGKEAVKYELGETGEVDIDVKLSVECSFE